ncbi:hypothetical protein SNL152K_7725 [Streptomyces sp. NL15-2K]|nr:hypothetical protein SNL152K_7725 [Streptomyces sp. NL15-2K]
MRVAEVQDEAGRGAYALYLKSVSDTSRDEVLLDPDTWLCAGYRSLDRSSRNEDWGKGDVVISSARLAVAVVDRKGEKP